MDEFLRERSATRDLSAPAPAPIAPTTTIHAAETFLPKAQSRRDGIALCLSGGGYRAALLHLGALRRLNELGVLSQIETISSVSGGSILAAHLAARIRPWPNPGEVVGDWEKRVAAPFRALTGHNLRTGPLLERLKPWNWLRSGTAVEALEGRYLAELTQMRLADLPNRPHFIFCATDLSFGVNWQFEQDRVGDYEAGWCSPVPEWPVARAVAASSCFPPIFGPQPLGLRPDQLKGGDAPHNDARTALINGLRLTDGGVYDNMGLEPVWQRYQHVLVSDGGAVFPFSGDRGLLWRLNRYTSVVGNQARAIRKRWLISNFVLQELQGAYWGLGSVTTHYGDEAPPGYSEPLVDARIVPIRTDLDGFSVAEASVLENHGYLLAAAAIQQHESDLIRVDAPVAVPHPQWMDEARVRRALRNSNKTRILGR